MDDSSPEISLLQLRRTAQASKISRPRNVMKDATVEEERPKKRPRPEDEVIEISSEEDIQISQQALQISELHGITSRLSRDAASREATTTTLSQDLQRLEAGWNQKRPTAEDLSLPQTRKVVAKLLEDVIGEKVKFIGESLARHIEKTTRQLREEKGSILASSIDHIKALLQTHKQLVRTCLNDLCKKHEQSLTEWRNNNADLKKEALENDACSREGVNTNGEQQSFSSTEAHLPRAGPNGEESNHEQGFGYEEDTSDYHSIPE
ncbi:MAG: hypothetical protein Q9218_003750 [Villophora microphyllina]